MHECTSPHRSHFPSSSRRPCAAPRAHPAAAGSLRSGLSRPRARPACAALSLPAAPPRRCGAGAHSLGWKRRPLAWRLPSRLPGVLVLRGCGRRSQGWAWTVQLRMCAATAACTPCGAGPAPPAVCQTTPSRLALPWPLSTQPPPPLPAPPPTSSSTDCPRPVAAAPDMGGAGSKWKYVKRENPTVIWQVRQQHESCFWREGARRRWAQPRAAQRRGPLRCAAVWCTCFANSWSAAPAARTMPASFLARVRTHPLPSCSPASTLQIMGDLGSGTYGKVHHVRHRTTRQVSACCGL